MRDCAVVGKNFSDSDCADIGNFIVYRCMVVITVTYGRWRASSATKALPLKSRKTVILLPIKAEAIFPAAASSIMQSGQC